MCLFKSNVCKNLNTKQKKLIQTLDIWQKKGYNTHVCLRYAEADMILELINILKNDGAVLPFDLNLDLGKISFGGVDFSFDTPCHVTGSVKNISGVMRLYADVSGEANVPCGRCTAPLKIRVNYNIEETLSSAAESDSVTDNGDDAVTLSGSTLDLKQVVLDNFFSNAGTKYLCKPDCKGLCPHCGVDRNKTECNCASDVTDPRLSVLNDLFK